ncbi:uncharacterized protein C2orf16 isoform X1 [Ctenocephalides felis]|uniref:uncharacterized protein C2orf16 isoform X1 n=1 Tax=Ctenocephalides felis TaxID=7515 RepID=UPI000E6E47F9|nr:uncharacterized protein C2orf16 isoform X1 [Ctenocephalides felis]
MSSRSRNSGSMSSKVPSSARLRMDRNPVHARINDPSLPATKRREIDNVIRKARASSSNGQWDKKVIEAEERDPNRWRHTGYKKLYVDGDSSSDDSVRHRSRSRSRSRGRLRSPIQQRRRTPPASPIKSKDSRAAVAKTDHRSRTQPSKSRRPASPIRNAKSPSRSTLSSCSDDSCSVCTPKARRNRRSRSRSYSVPHTKSHASHASVKSKVPASRPRPASPPPKFAAKTKRRPEKSVSAVKSHGIRASTAKVSSRLRVVPPEIPHQPTIVTKRRVPSDIIHSKSSKPVLRSPTEPKKADKMRMQIHVKQEHPSGSHRHASPADSSAGSDSSDSITSCPTASTAITLSERFGKMAQFAIDRRDIENMRITKDSAGGDLKVMIEDNFRANSPRRYGSPAPPGHYPDELATTGPMGLSSWDDVRVRYEYYKGRGYLRDLNLEDYVKWEEWWYRYQDWLKQERYYEHWQRQAPRRRRKRVPISQRLH